MSTDVNLLEPISTSGDDFISGIYKYRYASTRNGTFPSEEIDIFPCSQKQNLIRSNFDSKIERIKQAWSCVIIDFNETEITAQIEDITHPGNPDELATFLVEEIEIRDRPIIAKGAIFLWQVGYRYGPKYPRERFSKITFRRLAKWTEEDLQSANAHAKEYANYFFTNSTNKP